MKTNVNKIAITLPTELSALIHRPGVAMFDGGVGVKGGGDTLKARVDRSSVFVVFTSQSQCAVVKSE